MFELLGESSANLGPNQANLWHKFGGLPIETLAGAKLPPLRWRCRLAVAGGMLGGLARELPQEAGGVRAKPAAAGQCKTLCGV